MPRLYFCLGFIFLNLPNIIHCIKVTNGIKVDCTLRAELQKNDGSDYDVCNNCINPDDMSPRNITSDLTCMKSYILPESKDQIRTVKDYISCKTDAISYVCAGPCKSFKCNDINCRNCVP
ncbi:hypothetical protein BY996DRAFT_3816867 [Phakopsora pachyrhizi]|nr:hypothetical protein BY996DRAFT_3816867 [Phakopsora pachyrhizi]